MWNTANGTDTLPDLENGGQAVAMVNPSPSTPALSTLAPGRCRLWFWEWNEYGRYVHAGSGCESIYGRDADEMCGLSFADLLPAKDRARHVERVEAILAERRPFHGLAMPALRDDGDLVLREISGEPLYGPDGTFLGYRGVDRILNATRRSRDSDELVSIIDHFAEGFLALDCEFRIVHLNAAAAGMLGETPGRVVGATLVDAFPDLKDSVLEACCTAAFHQNREVASEVFLDSPSKPGWYSLRSMPADDGIRVYLRAVNDSRERDEALQSIIDCAPNLTGEALFKHLVRHLARVLGHRFASVVELVDTDARSAVTCAVWNDGDFAENLRYDVSGTPCEAVIRDGSCCIADEFCNHYPEDRRLTALGVVSYLGEAIRDSAGRIVGVLAIMDDKPMERVSYARALLRVFAQRVAAELVHKQTQKELHRLAMAIEQAAEIIVITNTDGTIRYVNPAFERITGFSREEAIGQNPRILKSGRHPAEFYSEMWEALGRGEVWSGRITNCRKDGTQYEEEVTISPVRDTDGNTSHYVAVKRDVTREVRLEQQLLQSQKLEALGTLAGGIAHDFNNILGAILGYTSLIGDEASPGSNIRVYTAELSRAAHRAADLVRQILTFSRKNRGEREPVRLSPLVKEALKLIRGSLPSTIEVRHRIDPHCPCVLADATQVHQVLVNLCTNAFHAMEEGGGTLTVALESVSLSAEQAEELVGVEPGRFVRLTVADTGSGMDDDTKARIFDPFFTTKPEGKGTGLGLALVHGIVRSCEGAVQVTSERGLGSVFQVYLPVHDGPSRTSFPTGHDMPRGAGERILLVDDEPALIHVGQRMLTMFGYEVEAFTDGMQALGRLKEDPNAFQLLVTDGTMPRMTGLELTRHVRELRPDMPIILTTGLATNDTRDRAIQAGVDVILAKPLGANDFAQAVYGILNKKRD